MTLKSYRTEREKLKLLNLRKNAQSPTYTITPTSEQRYSNKVVRQMIQNVQKPPRTTPLRQNLSHDLIKLAEDTVLKLNTTIDIVRGQTPTPNTKPKMPKLRIKRSCHRQPVQKVLTSGLKTKISNFQVQKRTVLGERNF